MCKLLSNIQNSQLPMLVLGAIIVTTLPISGYAFVGLPLYWSGNSGFNPLLACFFLSLLQRTRATISPIWKMKSSPLISHPPFIEDLSMHQLPSQKEFLLYIGCCMWQSVSYGRSNWGMWVLFGLLLHVPLTSTTSIYTTKLMLQ